MDIDQAIAVLANEKNVKFKDLLRVCEEFFEGPKIEGSHHIFKTPWEGRPWINIQKDKKMAKQYQVKQVKDALKKLKEIQKNERA